MQAQRLILETDQSGNIKNFPKLPPNKQIEGIFLILDDLTQTINSTQAPHPDLAGKVQITANIFDTVPEQDWEILQ